MSDLKRYDIREPWIKIHCALGESPFWEDATDSLRFVDVEKQQLHRVDLSKGPESHTIVKTLDIAIGVTADIQDNDNDFIFGGKYGYGVCNRSTGDYHWLKKVWTEEEVNSGKHERFRGNDGAVDSQGRFWAGFMFDPLVTEMNSEGAVFRLDPDLSLHRPLDKIKIPNGTAWNQTDNIMYFADSPEKTIYQFEYDAQTGRVQNRKPFFVMPKDNQYGEDAVPDGHCIDEEGHMWTALHGGSRVIRISPGGDVVAEIKVPTLQPTCPCFVGEDLVITSAGGTAGPKGAPLDEYAGCVFKIHVGVRGLRKFKFKGGVAFEGGKEAGKIAIE